MLPQQASNNKKYFLLAAVSAAMSIIFSVMSAPFIRVLAATKSKIFWLVGIVFVSSLFFLKMNLVAIYVGTIWMTLGLYSELEKKGITWKKSGALSVLAGVAFGAISFLAITKWSVDHELFKQVIDPLMVSLKQVLPEENFETKAVMMFMPGLLASALISALAVSLVFEAQIFQAFQIKRERLASGLKWLEFRLPDMFIWVSLFSFLFSVVETPFHFLQVIAINLAVVSIISFFFQGISVFEFAMRIFRVGRITKLLLYLLIITWALPVITVLGFADYWVDFRRHMRKKVKVS
ncbi:DUF2232 domain-containing protein [Pseudobdellovibrio sp. HCB154]|uniref:DUF2232 domain-containing protein n=1 Tax=Pseudobdellovibrio sp. HCB154 TaxID=3386277 RepID=UPI0039175C26